MANFQQLRMAWPVHIADLVEERAQASDFLARVLVVRVVDVSNQVGKRCRRPVLGSRRILPDLSRACGGLDGVDDLLNRNLGLSAGLHQGLIPAAAIINPKLLENASGGGDAQSDFADRLLYVNAHFYPPEEFNL